MKKITSFFLFLCAPLLALPVVASAHVKWFAESEGFVRPYSLSDAPVLVWIVVSLLLIGVGVWLERKLGVPAWLKRHIEAWAPIALSVASVGFGLAFIIFSFNGFIFAPNMPAEGTMGTVLLAIQFVAGLMILLGLYERVGALILVALFGLAFKEYGASYMLDTLEMLGFAMYVLLIGRPRWHLAQANWLEPLVHRAHVYGVPLLRVFTGLNLFILGFSEKILAPELTQNFLAGHNWNFMQQIGFHGFTDYWFAFSAGVVEVLFGIFLMLGLITRTTTIILAVFLSATLVVLGPVELMGHLPHFSIAIVFLIMGVGARLRFVRG